jgi:hypothetical protein
MSADRWTPSLHPRDAFGKFSLNPGGEKKTQSGYKWDEIDAISRYRDGNDVNHQLRENAEHGYRFSSANVYKRHTESLDSAMHRAPLAEDTTTYRWVPPGALPGDLSPGDRIVDHGFMSTSGDPTVTADFGDHRLEIDLPANTPVVHFPSVKGLERDRYFDAQDEYLLPRGTVLEVISIEPLQTGNPNLDGGTPRVERRLSIKVRPVGWL